MKTQKTMIAVLEAATALRRASGAGVPERWALVAALKAARDDLDAEVSAACPGLCGWLDDQGLTGNFGAIFSGRKAARAAQATRFAREARNRASSRMAQAVGYGLGTPHERDIADVEAGHSLAALGVI